MNQQAHTHATNVALKQRSAHEDVEEGLQYQLMDQASERSIRWNNSFRNSEDNDKHHCKLQHCNDQEDDLQKKHATPVWTYQRRRFFQMFFVFTMVSLFLLTASGYHRRQLHQRLASQSRRTGYKLPRKTFQQQREERKRAKDVLAQLRSLPHSWEDIQKAEEDEERVRQEESRVRQVWLQLQQLPHDLEDLDDDDDDDDRDDDDGSFLDWMSDKLGQAAEDAGGWVHSTTENIMGDEWTDNVSHALSSSLESVGEWVDNTLATSDEEYDDEELEAGEWDDLDEEQEQAILLDEGEWDSLDEEREQEALSSEDDYDDDEEETAESDEDDGY